MNLIYTDKRLISKIINNIKSLFIGNMSSKVLTAIATILVTRSLQPSNYGLYVVAIAYSSVFGYMTDLGLNQTFIREVSKDLSNISLLLKTNLVIRTVLAILVSGILILLTSVIYGSTSEQGKMILIAAIPAIFGVTWFGQAISYYQIVERMQNIALIRISLSLLILLFVLFGNLFNKSIYYFSFMFGLSHLIIGLVFLIVMYKKIINVNVDLLYSNLLKGLSWFTFNGVLTILIPQAGPILLSLLIDSSNVGFYGAAYRFPSLLLVIPLTVTASFYPFLFKQWYKDHKKVNYYVNKELSISISLAIVASLPMITLPEIIVSLLYGDKYMDNSMIYIIRILVLIVPFQGINYPLLDKLTISGRQKERSIILFISWLVGTLIFILFTVYFGIIGSALGTLLVDIIMFTILIFKKGNLENVIAALRRNIPLIGIFTFSVAQAMIFNNIYVSLILFILAIVISILNVKKENESGEQRIFL